MKTFRSVHFTLIELMVVVGVILILLSLLLPGINSARGVAKRISCASNMRQVGMKIMYYVNDYNDYGPVVGGYDLANILEGAYITASLGASDYRADKTFPKGLYFCPETNTVATCTKYKLSYPLTVSLCDAGGVGGGWYYGSTYSAPRVFSRINQGSVILTEAPQILWGTWAGQTWACPDLGGWVTSSNANNNWSVASCKAPYDNHSNKGNFLLKDGSVQTYSRITHFGNTQATEWIPNR